MSYPPPGPPGEQPPGDQPYSQQPYSQQPYSQQPYQAPAQDHPRATLILILGILGIVVCGLIAPFAWRMGRQALAEIDGSGGRLGGRGMVQAGYILGIIGTVLLALAILIAIVVMVIAIIGGMAATV